MILFLFWYSPMIDSPRDFSTGSYLNPILCTYDRTYILAVNIEKLQSSIYSRVNFSKEIKRRPWQTDSSNASGILISNETTSLNWYHSDYWFSWILRQSIECKYYIAEESETTKLGEFMGLLLLSAWEIARSYRHRSHFWRFLFNVNSVPTIFSGISANWH